MGKKILVIDDEPMILDVVKLLLEDMGHEVTVYSDSIEGEKAAILGEYDLILTDVRMPGRNGAEIVAAVLEKKPAARILVITAQPGDSLACQALAAGAAGLLRKPFEIARILDYLPD